MNYKENHLCGVFRYCKLYLLTYIFFKLYINYKEKIYSLNNLNINKPLSVWIYFNVSASSV